MDKRILFVVGAVILLALLILGFKKYFGGAEECQKAIFSVSERKVLVGTEISFKDESPNAKQWKWDMGDGSGTFETQEGKYKYDNPGRYIISLIVNNKIECKDTFAIVVEALVEETSLKPVAAISGPSEGKVGEKLEFACLAEGAKKYDWKFGYSGRIDSREQKVTYTYKMAGTYQVSCSTDVSEPVYKTVIITKPIATTPPTVNDKPIVKQETKVKEEKPKPAPTPAPTNSKTISASELKNRLTQIADNGSLNYNDNREWIADNFLNNQNTDVKLIKDGKTETKKLASFINECKANAGQIQIISADMTTDKKTGKINMATITYRYK